MSESPVRPRECEMLGCGNPPITGSARCFMHGGITPGVRQAARMRLLTLVDPALNTLLDAMTQRDHWPTAVRAAETVLNRAGFHEKQSVVLEDERGTDIATIPLDKLEDRATQLIHNIQEAKRAAEAKNLDLDIRRRRIVTPEASMNQAPQPHASKRDIH